jgi:hypothetical protein
VMKNFLCPLKGPFFYPLFLLVWLGLFLTSSLESHWTLLTAFLYSWASSSAYIPKTTDVILVASYLNSIWSQFHPDTLLRLEITMFWTIWQFSDLEHHTNFGILLLQNCRVIKQNAVVNKIWKSVIVLF